MQLAEFIIKEVGRNRTMDETNWGYGEGASDCWDAFSNNDVEVVRRDDLIEEVKTDIENFFERYKKSLILRYNLLKR